MANPYEGIKSAESTTTLQPGYQNQADPSLIIHQLDPDPVLIPLKIAWLGLIKQEDGTYLSGKLPKRMNEIGVSSVIEKIRLRFCHFTSLSNLSEDEIYRMKEEFEHDLNELLFFKEDEFELDAAYRDNIINDAGQAVLIGLCRAKNQGERVFLSKTFESKQIFQEREKQKKGIKQLFPW